MIERGKAGAFTGRKRRGRRNQAEAAVIIDEIATLTKHSAVPHRSIGVISEATASQPKVNVRGAQEQISYELVHPIKRVVLLAERRFTLKENPHE